MVSPRRLAFKDRFVWELEQVVSTQWDDCDDFADRYVFPDMTTRVPLVMYLSQQEFTTLYSAVLTGADLTYPNTSHNVEQLFLQVVNCAMSQLCAAIATCIDESSLTQAALTQFLADNGFNGGVGDGSAPMSDGSLEENLLPAGYVCTDDKAFGMALAIADAINDATSEVLQAIEVLTNPIEIAAELGDNMPGVGILASAGDIAAWIQDTAKEEYDLAWSTVIRDELACLIWCAFKQDCDLTYDMIFDIYLTAAAATPPVSLELVDWLAWLILLPFTAPLSTVSAISLLGLLAMRYGGSFGDFSLGIRSLKTVMALSADASSSDWSIVCDPCPDTWCYTIDFTAEDGGFFASPEFNLGTYVPGVGWETEFYSPGGTPSYSMVVERTVNAYITKVIYNYDLNGHGGDDVVALYKHQGAAFNLVCVEPSIIGFNQTLECDFDDTVDGIVINISGKGSWVATVHNIEIHGTGTNPFGSSNC